jgi:hypothetical protein
MLNVAETGVQVTSGTPPLTLTGVGVEKLDLSENRPKRSDQKCIGDRRKSFIGHPDATHFRRKFCERVFQQLQAITRFDCWSVSVMAIFEQLRRAVLACWTFCRKRGVGLLVLETGFHLSNIALDLCLSGN